jgi:hypothetical protein
VRSIWSSHAAKGGEQRLPAFADVPGDRRQRDGETLGELRHQKILPV